MIPALFFLFFTLASFNSEANEGKQIYTSVCMKCHNANPSKPGSIGPDLYTTPLAVFKTKVVTGTYPAGYKPKRKTRIMPKFHHLTTKVNLVYNYIRSTKR